MRREGMQGRNRSPIEGLKPGTGRMSPERPFQGPGMYGSGSRTFRRGGGGGGYRRAPPKPHFSSYPRPPPPPVRRKADVLMEAGRLAAEYLVTKGLLPPSSLPPPPPSRWPSNGIGQEFKARDRDNSVFDGRVSALDRLGGADGGSGRKRHIDEYDSGGWRNSSRGRRRRMDQYNNVGHESNSDWRSREKDKNVQRMDRSRSFGDGNGSAYGDDEDDCAPGYRRVGFEDVGDGGSVRGSGAAVDGEQNYRNEVTGESEMDNRDFEDDLLSKASVSGSRKDSTPERDENFQKDVDDGSPSHKENRKVKSDKSNSEVGHEDEEMEERFDSSAECKEQDLLKSFTFPKVPTRRRSAVGSRGLKFAQASATADTGKDEAQTAMESGVACSPISLPEPELDAENISKDCSSSDKVTDSACSLVCSITEKSSVLPGSHSEKLESANSEFSLEAKAKTGSLPLLEKSLSVQHRIGSNDVNPDPVFDTDSKIYAKSYSFPERSSVTHNQVELEQESGFTLNIHSAVKMENESLRQDVTSEDTSSRTRDWSSPMMLHDYELSNQKKPVNAELFAKIEPGPGMNVKDKKHLFSNSFKICDLNLIHAHDVTEIHDDPVVEHEPTSSLSIDNGDIPTVDFGLSVGHSNTDIGIYDRPSGDNKIIQVIDLEDDSPAEDEQSDILKPKSEAMYSNLENFLNQTDNAVDLPDIHDGYGLPMSDLLGTDMSNCPAVSGEMNGLQQGMGLLEEGLSGDVSIYGSFEEIPISFMEPWDPPPQEYGKYF